MIDGRILVIDDEPEHAELIGLLLERRGYRVEVTSDARIGLERAEREPPALIVIDWFMPEVDGVSAVAHLGRSDRTRRVPILLVSACGDELAARTLPPHVLRLPKPFHATALWRAVDQAVRAERRLGQAGGG
jgi:CheY-like chemotaxis protein